MTQGNAGGSDRVGGSLGPITSHNAPTGMSRANVELIERFERLFEEGDPDGALALLTDDFVVREAPSMPYPGVYRGAAGFLELAEAFGKVWRLTAPQRQILLPAGDDRVVGIGEFDAVAVATGRSCTVKVAEIYTIRDGRIAAIDPYYHDTAAIVEVTNGQRIR